MRLLREVAGFGSLVAIGLTAMPEIVLAASSFWDTPTPTPAPLVGVGLPIAGAVVAAVALVRHYRRKA